MKASELERFIEKLGKKGSVLGVESMLALLERMENPHLEHNTIHIAGTNGKGSVLAFVSTILQCAGYRVGRYCSPVISDYREKIQVNQKSISQSALLRGMEKICDITEQMEAEGIATPTLFEAETALAFWYFKEKKCDFIVVETGLGGEQDATNVFAAPLVNVFTSISMDHMNYLGNTLSRIANVKAGIIKMGAEVVSAVQQEEVKQVLDRKAAEQKTKVNYASEPKQVTVKWNKQTFSYGTYKKLEISLAGSWQPENAGVAIETIEALRRKGFHISEEALRKGLKETQWPGRFTLLQKKPLFIMDGAHNEAASIRLAETMEQYLKDIPKIFIIGVLKDKEYEKVVCHTVPLAEHIITVTPPENPRALSAYDLACAVREYHSGVTAVDSVEEAVEMAHLLAGERCAIVAFGSLSYLGRLQKTVLSRKASPKKK